ncbi:unnamed protein product, partial [Ectocarpus sp. 8 AP-2014]
VERATDTDPACRQTINMGRQRKRTKLTKPAQFQRKQRQAERKRQAERERSSGASPDGSCVLGHGAGSVPLVDSGV